MTRQMMSSKCHLKDEDQAYEVERCYLATFCISTGGLLVFCGILGWLVFANEEALWCIIIRGSLLPCDFLGWLLGRWSEE